MTFFFAERRSPQVPGCGVQIVRLAVIYCAALPSEKYHFTVRRKIEMQTNKSKYDVGVIHGRFQVLHNDHLKYLLAGKSLCGHLVIGITNPDPFLVKEEQADRHRSSDQANPLTYFERYRLLRTALVEAGVEWTDFSIVPMPISMPGLYRHYVPLDAVFFLSIYDEWGRRKKSYFESLGLKVHVLWEVSPERKGISGSEVRSRMMRGQSWENAVPVSVAVLLREWGIPERLQKIKRKDS
jgi:nicotinamide-nucleotide adenylyltransferase